MIQSMESVEDVSMILIVRKHKDGGISFDTNTNSKHDAYCMAQLCVAYALADMMKSTLKEPE